MKGFRRNKHTAEASLLGKPPQSPVKDVTFRIVHPLQCHIRQSQASITDGFNMKKIKKLEVTQRCGRLTRLSEPCCRGNR